jgi:hypothetical protein
MWNVGRAGASNAAQHAIANATMASIFLEAFSFAMRNPRGDSIATVFIACWRNALLRLPDRHPDPEDVVTALDLVVGMLLPVTERRDQQWRAPVGRLRRELVRLRAAGVRRSGGDRPPWRGESARGC